MLSSPLIRLHCVACGNAVFEDDNGAVIPLKFRLTERQLAMLRAELSMVDCSVCGGPMQAELIEGDLQL